MRGPTIKSIRKISIGEDYLNGSMKYTVGQTLMKGFARVDNIIQVAPNTYEIWVENDKGEIDLWKSVEDMPVVLEYNLI